MKALLHVAWASALNRRGTLALVVLSIALATALLLVAALTDCADALPWLLVVAFAGYAILGGALITWAFQTAKDACDDPMAAVEASRVCVLAQNAGLTLGLLMMGDRRPPLWVGAITVL